MNIEIKKLSPKLVDDYINFFDTSALETKENKCYCICWCSADHSDIDDLASQNMRELAIEYIKNGMLQGYLVYDGEQVIGWCNTNEKNNCTKCMSWLKYMQEVKITADDKVKSIFCFVIAPEYRRNGVATKLLEQIISDAKVEGYDYIEAYPRIDTNLYSNFQGYTAMYEKAGFEKMYDTTDKIVMRKRLL